MRFDSEKGTFKMQCY